MDASYKISVTRCVSGESWNSDTVTVSGKDVTYLELNHFGPDYVPKFFTFTDYDGKEHPHNVCGRSWYDVQSEIDLCIEENNRKFQCATGAPCNDESDGRPSKNSEPPFFLNWAVDWFGGFSSSRDEGGKRDNSVSSGKTSGITVFLGCIYAWFCGLLGPALGLKLSISIWRVCLEESDLIFKYILLFPFAIIIGLPIGIISTIGLAYFLLFLFGVAFGEEDSIIARIVSLLLIVAATGFLFIRLGFQTDLPWAVKHLIIFLVWLWHFIVAVLRWLLSFIW